MIVTTHTRAFLTSLLVKRRDAMGVERFVEKHPGAWLVWEPGKWNPAPSAEESDAQATQRASRSTARPLKGDALVFVLDPEPPRDLVLGRSSEAHVLVNDMTVSREHLRLTCDAAGWAVSAIAPTTLDDEPLFAGRLTPLSNGARLACGDVRFTFYDSTGFLERLTASAGRR